MEMGKEKRYALAARLDAIAELLPLDEVDAIEQAIKIISPEYDEYCEKLLQEVEAIAENYKA